MFILKKSRLRLEMAHFCIITGQCVEFTTDLKLYVFSKRTTITECNGLVQKMLDNLKTCAIIQFNCFSISIVDVFEWE